MDAHTAELPARHPLGRLARHDAPAVFAPKPYVRCLDLGGAGVVFTTGWERTVRLAGPEVKACKRMITERWIHPPLDDAEELLRQADPTTVVPRRRGGGRGAGGVTAGGLAG
ncbi:hypothetical protein [Streptomyces altiplanensis]